MHNVKLCRERQANQFPTYPLPEFNIGHKMIVLPHVRDVWDAKYDVFCTWNV